MAGSASTAVVQAEFELDCYIVTHAQALVGADLNALRSKGPAFQGRDASDNCSEKRSDQQLPHMRMTQVAEISMQSYLVSSRAGSFRYGRPNGLSRCSSEA